MNKKGFTLIEILVAVGIFALVISGVVGTFILSVELSRKINYEYTATYLAKNRIERLKHIDYALLTDAQETDTPIDENSVPSESGDYLRTTAVTANYGGDSHLTMVQVDVHYYYKGVKNNQPARMTMLFSDLL